MTPSSRLLIFIARSSCSPQSHLWLWKTSPVRHSEWIRTFISRDRLPCTRARCSLHVVLSTNPYILKSPKSVGSLTVLSSVTPEYFFICFCRASIVIIFRPCFFLYVLHFIVTHPRHHNVSIHEFTNDADRRSACKFRHNHSFFRVSHALNDFPVLCNEREDVAGRIEILLFHSCLRQCSDRIEP